MVSSCVSVCDGVLIDSENDFESVNSDDFVLSSDLDFEYEGEAPDFD